MKFAHPILSVEPAGRALDLACGTGEDSRWLEARGWRVTAVDRNAEAIAALRAEGIDAHVADLEKGEFRIEPGAWDLIVICRYLQRDLYEPAKAGLRRGGLMVASALLPGETPGRFRIAPGELAGYFRGFEILHSHEGKLAEIVARKT